jgi:hypothetical protein
MTVIIILPCKHPRQWNEKEIRGQANQSWALLLQVNYSSSVLLYRVHFKLVYNLSQVICATWQLLCLYSWQFALPWWHQ